MVGGCIGIGSEQIGDVVVVVVERDPKSNLVGDMVLGWATTAAVDSLNIQSMACTVSGRTLSLKFGLRVRRQANTQIMASLSE